MEEESEDFIKAQTEFDIYKNTDMTVPIEYSCVKSSIIMLGKYLSNYLNAI